VLKEGGARIGGGSSYHTGRVTFRVHVLVAALAAAADWISCTAIAMMKGSDFDTSDAVYHQYIKWVL
jgi:hypothetical protein